MGECPCARLHIGEERGRCMPCSKSYCQGEAVREADKPIQFLREGQRLYQQSAKCMGPTQRSAHVTGIVLEEHYRASKNILARLCT